MPLVQDVLTAIDQIAPWRTAYDGDKVGLQVGSPSAPISRALVTLDRSEAAVRKASEIGAQLLLAHHPLIWTPIETLGDDHLGRTVRALVRHDIAFVAAHTNWDVAIGGVSEAMAMRMGLTEVSTFGHATPQSVWKLVVFVPESDAEALVDVLAAAGAGAIGLYRRCAFSSSGTGTFEPIEGANPAIGHVGNRESVDEIRVEMIVPGARVAAVERALREAHPYEEPAFDFLQARPLRGLAVGRVGSLPERTLRELVEQADRAFGTKSLAWGSPDLLVHRLAVVGGAGDDQWRLAQAAGAEAMIAGEVRQHTALEASEEGFALIQSGHYATEQPGVEALAQRMREVLPQVDWVLWDPEQGTAGRPFWV